MYLLGGRKLYCRPALRQGSRGGVDRRVGVDVRGSLRGGVSTLVMMLTVTSRCRSFSRLAATRQYAANGCRNATSCAGFRGRGGRFIYCGRVGRDARRRGIGG